MFAKETRYTMSVAYHLSSLEYDHSTGKLFGIITQNVSLVRIATYAETGNLYDAGTIDIITKVAY